jgi:hypothetical protein
MSLIENRRRSALDLSLFVGIHRSHIRPHGWFDVRMEVAMFGRPADGRRRPQALGLGGPALGRASSPVRSGRPRVLRIGKVVTWTRPSRGRPVARPRTRSGATGRCPSTVLPVLPVLTGRRRRPWRRASPRRGSHCGKGSRPGPSAHRPIEATSVGHGGGGRVDDLHRRHRLEFTAGEKGPESHRRSPRRAVTSRKSAPSGTRTPNPVDESHVCVGDVRYSSVLVSDGVATV